MKIVIFFIFFAQNMDGGYTEAVLTSTHNLCFRAKIRKKYTPANPSFTILEWDVSGPSLQGHICMMLKISRPSQVSAA